MSRKPKPKLTAVHLAESNSPSVDGAGLQFGNTSNTVERAEIQPEKERSLERVDPQPKLDPANFSSGRKGQCSASVGLRRSSRLQNVGISPCSHNIEHTVREITISESEKEDEPDADEEEKQPGTDIEDRKDQDNIDHMLDLQKQQIKILQEMRGSPTLGHDGYKRMYIDSQRKIETLTKENRELTRKLDIARAKREGYENAKHFFTEVMEKMLKMKDVIAVSNQIKSAEIAAVNNSFQATADFVAHQDTTTGCEVNPPPMKRKKHKK